MRNRRIGVAMLAACTIGMLSTAHAREATSLPVARETPDPSAGAVAGAQRAWRTGAAVRLAVEGGARELALAAILISIDDVDAEGNVARVADRDAAAWRRRASATAAQDVIANLLLANSSRRGERGPEAEIRRAAADRWHAAEPDNLAPLLYMDLAPADLVAAAAASRRFSLHYVETIRWVAQALAAHPPAADVQATLDAHLYAAGRHAAPEASEEATLHAAAMVTAFAIPNLQQLTAACAVDAMDDDPARRDACARIAAAMREASDTEVGAMIGSAIARRLASPAELDTLDAEDRQRRWRAQQMGIATSGDMARDLHRLYADPALTTEQALAERLITDAGLPLVPPRDWTPRSAF